MDLTASYLGLALKSPVVASAGPLNRDIDNLKRLEECGAGAVVLPSVFEDWTRRMRGLRCRHMGEGMEDNTVCSLVTRTLDSLCPRSSWT